jgi:3-methyladenine DNA glycosylase AlkD
MMKKSAFTLKVESDLKKLRPKTFSGKFKLEDYVKGNGHELSKLKFLNLKMPVVRQYLDSLDADKKSSRGPQYFEKMNQLWFESDTFDSKIIPLYWLDHQSTEFLIKNQKQILKWVSEIDNWAHADAYCSAIARIFEFDQKNALPTYLKWNKHKSSWLRRCSMVGTFYYSYHREIQPSFELAKKLVSPHFKAEEYYVQKAVGWTIREMYNVYPEKTVQFIKQNNFQLSSVAWVAATEKLPEKIKHRLLVQRKQFRQSN